MELPRLLTVRSARRYGLTIRQLRGPRFRRLTRGVYAAGPAEPSLTERAAAALLVLPADAVITGVTALWLYGVELGSPEPIRAATATTGQSRRRGIRLSRVGRVPQTRSRMVSPVQAWVGSCSELDLVQAVAAADWLMRLGRCELAELGAAAQATGGRGRRLAQRAAALARTGVDSPKESTLRLMLVLAGLPEPACNPMIGNRTEPIGHFDLVLGEFMIIIEYDGDHHRTDRWQWARDIARHEAAVNAGYAIIRITNGRMMHPREIVQTVDARLRERGYQGPSPRFTPEWHRLFDPDHRS
ncbi:endonuclease domain-containing protein [Microlunatus speluncae]|uniref:endonuclease domain-containing protein n=1 Tax=Microlunatus speluncae TaxID=2594267 RepID=UPI0012662824|nr:DUF559 domain-containing protein [Microlunatus speluncae]